MQREINRTLRLWEVDIHRFPDCPLYEECLLRAAVKNWISFTCTLCPLYVPPEERIEDEDSRPKGDPEYDPLSGHIRPYNGRNYR